MRTMARNILVKRSQKMKVAYEKYLFVFLELGYLSFIFLYLIG